MCFDIVRTQSAKSSIDGFSPLFIGACVSTIAFARSVQRSTSFSPLFIGACVSTFNFADIPIPFGKFQSPLHRGMCFDAFPRYSSWCGCVRFQSPLHRGICFDYLILQPSPLQCSGFSPLFIGACVSTGRVVPFQLPLLSVSVPSSSGHVFRRASKSAVAPATNRFSPLFIGACVSTVSPHACRTALLAVSVPSSSGHVFRPGEWFNENFKEYTFQSPLHRGMCFDSVCWSVCWLRCRCFSPLFIGACVSTGGQQLHPRDRRAFQSPLHRGMCFDIETSPNSRKAFAMFQSPLHRGMCFDQVSLVRGLQYYCVSVPSSSGHVFRRPNSSIFSGLSSRFQSPLHRGMCFDLSKRVFVHKLADVSVPSSSGHVFRPSSSG